MRMRKYIEYNLNMKEVMKKLKIKGNLIEFYVGSNKFTKQGVKVRIIMGK